MTVYILDTSVLVTDPNSFKAFENSTIIIPVNVLDELDKLKTFPGEIGRNARVFIRTLDKLCLEGEIHKGINLENGSTIKVDTNSYKDQFGDSKTYVDNKILACAFELSKQLVTSKIILVSNDINLRCRAWAAGLSAQDYKKSSSKSSELFQGHIEINNKEIGLLLSENGVIDCCTDELQAMSQNECVHITGDNGKGLAIGKKVGKRIRLVELKNPYELALRNKEQAMAIELLLDPSIPLVTLVGKAGCGKTLCAIAAALECVITQKRYKRLMVIRPMESVGKEMGHLPGTKEEKLEPWMAPINDAFEVLGGSTKSWKPMFERHKEKGVIQFEALSYIRGRSLPDSFIIIDESQNISQQEIKTILTRAGTGTKIVLTGDIEQIDHINLDAMNNGLSYVIDKFRDSSLAGHITLTKGERSPLATEAAEIL